MLLPSTLTRSFFLLSSLVSLINESPPRTPPLHLLLFLFRPKPPPPWPPPRRPALLLSQSPLKLGSFPSASQPPPPQHHVSTAAMDDVRMAPLKEVAIFSLCRFCVSCRGSTVSLGRWTSAEREKGLPEEIDMEKHRTVWELIYSESRKLQQIK